MTTPHFPVHSASVLLSGTTLGVMGGGQLGRMFVQAAQQMGYFTAVLDADEDSPAGCISHHHICSSYTDKQGLQQLAAYCGAITTEFENVPATSLEFLAQHCPVFPQAKTVLVAQDRLLEKELFMKSGIGCVPHQAIQSEIDICNAQQHLFPGILKTTRLGYDGKGQISVNDASELQAAWEALKQVPCILEKKVDLAFEVSVLVARNQQGQTIHFPVQRNIHRNGILAVTQVPRLMTTDPIYHEATIAAKELVQTLNYVGVMCVEFFILKDQSLIANEIAPRPHNSAHWTMDACSYSQFEAQVRTLTGLPLPAPVQMADSIMLNLLGDLWFVSGDDSPCTPKWDQVLELTGTHLHLYGKTEAKRGRKMGHLNITAPTFDEARATALQAAHILGIAPW